MSRRVLAAMAGVLGLAVVGVIPALGATPGTLSGESFRTPSGNIHCSFDGDGLRCDLIRNTAKVPARPRDCELDWGNAFYLPVRGRAVRLCHGDTVVNPGAPVLAYGRRWERAGITCLSASSGLTCVNRIGRMFTLASARQTIG